MVLADESVDSSAQSINECQSDDQRTPPALNPNSRLDAVNIPESHDASLPNRMIPVEKYDHVVTDDIYSQKGRQCK
jgi:hypothetical protein